MFIRKVNFVKGEYYHIYNRGNSKQEIFHDKQDYEYFIGLLYLFNTKENLNLFHFKRNKNFDLYLVDLNQPLVSVGVYCLMPNHFHILITETEEGSISKFMQKVSTGYVMYYNKKYKRTGSLFEGKFKSQHAADDRYLKYLFSYIHLNPIKLIQKDWKEKGIKNKKQAVEYLSKYKYSSYIDYLKIERVQNKILNIKAFPDYFHTKQKFQLEIFEWINSDILKMH
ncbi:MAG: transposase [Candidatus Paceibacterota bacterium]